MSVRLFCQFTNALPVSSFHPELAAHELLIWDIDTDLYLNRIALLEKVLSAEEKKRAYRFHFEKDTNRFIIRRALLKILLAAYQGQGCQTQEIRFATGINGKPHLAENTGLHFNLSHSDSHALIALSREQLGVDIELVRPDFDFGSIAEVLFSKTELEFLAVSVNPVKDFFTIWTRKEAFVKATGRGLNAHLQLLSCLDGVQLVNPMLTDVTEDWNIHTTMLPAGYLLSVATQTVSAPMNKLLVSFDDNLLPKGLGIA